MPPADARPTLRLTFTAELRPDPADPAGGAVEVRLDVRSGILGSDPAVAAAIRVAMRETLCLVADDLAPAGDLATALLEHAAVPLN